MLLSFWSMWNCILIYNAYNEILRQVTLLLYLYIILLYPGQSHVERIMDVIPRGTELELQLRRGVGQALYTCNNIHIKCIGVYWAQAEKYCYKWTVWSSVLGILDPFTNNNHPASYKAAGHSSTNLQTALRTQGVFFCTRSHTLLAR